MNADDLIKLLLPLGPDLKIKVWLTNDMRDPGGAYAVTEAVMDKPGNSIILYVEDED